MRWHAHGQHQRALGAGRFRLLDAARDGRSRAGNDDLAQRIEVDRLKHFALRRLFAYLAHRIVLKTENGRHATLSCRYGGLHEAGAISDELNGFDEGYRLGTHERRVFAEAVAGHGRRHRPALGAPHTPHGDTGGQHRRLRGLGLVEFLFRSPLDDSPQVVTEGLRRLGEGFLHLRELARERVQHADRLRTLAGKNKRKFHMFRKLYDYLTQRREGAKETKAALRAENLKSPEFSSRLCAFAAKIHINTSTTPNPR